MQANYGHILALSLSLFLAGCCGIQGHVNEVDANGNVVVPIAGAEVTFRRANGSTRRATTNQAGHYRRWLTGGNYFISVNHIGHASYDSAPSTVKEALTKSEAEEIKGKLEDVGATVALK